jgi:hypothetical protein
VQNTHEWKKSHKWQELSQEDVIINEKITEKLAGTNTLVAILEHHGKLTVPRKNLMELIEIEQVWPNDFIYNHGASMAITYNKETDEMGFELMYSSDNTHPHDLVAYACTRNATEVGFVYHDSEVYKD